MVGDKLDMGLRLEDLKLSWSVSPDSSVSVSPARESGAGVGLGLLLLRLRGGGEEQDVLPALDLGWQRPPSSSCRLWYPDRYKLCQILPAIVFTDCSGESY